MNFQERFAREFADKYDFLNLKNVMVDKKAKSATITFLYSSLEKELSAEDKKHVIEWLKRELSLEKLVLRVKFMRVYLEEKLVRKEILSFFESKYKLVMSYINDKSFDIKINAIDTQISFVLSERMANFFKEQRIVQNLTKHLSDNFLSDFVFDIKHDDSLEEEVDIENVELKTKFHVAKRYNVEVLKEIVGKGILPQPEFLSNISGAKSSVIVGGYIKKLERREFVLKKGPREGQTKAYYNFTIADRKGKLECVYFCPKTKEKDLDALEENMFLLLHGDVRLNQINKLCLYVDKMAWAAEIESEEEEVKVEAAKDMPPLVEKLSSLAQDNMFADNSKYNAKIAGKTIVVFDIETTGFDPASEQITELGAVKIVDGVFVEKFSTLVKPTKPIPFEVVDITGITDEMVKDAPPIEYVIKEFFKFAEGSILAAHNGISFDMKFIKRDGAAVGLDFDHEVIDTLIEARKSPILKISRFNLGAVTKALGITLEGAHRAWNDAYATAEVLLKLNENKR